MGKVIALSDYKAEYKQQLEKALDDLSAFETILKDHLALLALNGHWKTWSDNQPKGALFSPSRQNFLDTGDEIMITLVDSVDLLFDLKEKIQKRLNQNPLI